jgi:tetratricopeptide (TPR) repeat protein
VVGHIPKALGLAGIVGGHDVVAHGEEYYWTFFGETADRSRLAEAARISAAAGLAVIPNTGFVRTILDQAEDIDAFLARPELRYADPAALANWLPETNRYLGRPPEWLPAIQRMHPFLRELTGELRRAGVPLFTGSDAGAVGGIPGASLHREIAELEASGLTRAEALAAATQVPGDGLAARAGLAPRGRLAAGQRADLVLLGADPLADPRALAAIEAVVAGGRWHEAAALERALAEGVPPAAGLLAWYRGVRAALAAGELERLEAAAGACASPAFAEAALNGLGYRALYGDRDAERAVRIFAANSRAFPASANVWDSLGEALAERGDTAAAIASYERSLALAPDNDNAARMLERLRGR